MEYITLSFCITTRNRAGYIGETLESLLSQATDGVEIVVLDAASTDGTREIVEGFTRRFSRLRYFHQKTNEGVDRDYDRTVELARGKYCWMMSDDDVLSPGAVNQVMEYLSSDFDLLVVNAEDRDSTLNRVILEKRLPFQEDKLYLPDDFERLFSDTAYHMSFIPSVIIRRNLWLARNRVPYFGSLFVHIGVIFQERLHGNAIVIAKPLVSVRNANVSWASRSFEIWMFKWPELIWSFKDIGDAAKSRVSPRDPWKNLKALMTHRAMGSYSMTEYRKWINPASSSRLDGFPAWLTALLPGHVANALCLLYCVLTYDRNKYPLYNLLHSRYCFLPRSGAFRE